MPNDRNTNTDALTLAGLVPYIASWSGERRVRATVVAKGRYRIGYQHERPGDRDAHGVLWTRYVRAPGDGVPQFGKVHPLRQRHAMRRLLCQICGGPADRNDQGVLWLIDDVRREWSGEEITPHPPVCLRCAATARRACPHLRRIGALALRVRHAPIVGVFGKLYALDRSGPILVGPATLAYDDPGACLLQANQLMRGLREWTVVDLNQELRTRDHDFLMHPKPEVRYVGGPNG
jgi:hypothetical protein